MKQEDIILEACEAMKAKYFYVGEDIPNKRLERLLEGIKIPKEEQIYALIDCTIFGSAKYGALFTNKGIHVKNDWTSQVREGYLDWETVIDADLTYTDKFTDKELWINNLYINMSGCSLTPTYLYEVLIHIQEKSGMIKGSHHPSVSPDEPPEPVMSEVSGESTSPQWMVTMQGKKYGPYETNTIGEMLLNGQLQAERNHIWKQGMREWILINESEQFQRFLTPPVPPTTSDKTTETSSDTIGESYDVIDMNKAELNEILTLPYFTLQKANDLLLKRQTLGPFNKIEEVQEIIQIQPHEFEELKQYIFVETAIKRPKVGRVIDY